MGVSVCMHANDYLEENTFSACLQLTVPVKHNKKSKDANTALMYSR